MTRYDIDRARALLARHFEATPLVTASTLSGGARTIHLKNETVLPTGSFKVRGALYALTVRIERAPVSEVVAASTGNHGAAVAYAARLLGVRARIFLPAAANTVKRARIRELGATLVENGRDLSAAIDAASEYCARTGAYFLHDAADRDIPTGTATIGAEILEQLPLPDAVFVPMGDTALIRGVATSFRLAGARARVVGVVAEGAPAYLQSWRRGAAIETDAANTIADGLAVRRALRDNVIAIRRLVDDVVAVSDPDMLDAIVRLRDGEGMLAEPSGVAALAALLRDRSAKGSCVALVTGGNLSPDVARALGPG